VCQVTSAWDGRGRRGRGRRGRGRRGRSRRGSRGEGGDSGGGRSGCVLRVEPPTAHRDPSSSGSGNTGRSTRRKSHNVGAEVDSSCSPDLTGELARARTRADGGSPSRGRVALAIPLTDMNGLGRGGSPDRPAIAWRRSDRDRAGEVGPAVARYSSRTAGPRGHNEPPLDQGAPATPTTFRPRCIGGDRRWTKSGGPITCQQVLERSARDRRHHRGARQTRVGRSRDGITAA